MHTLELSSSEIALNDMLHPICPVSHKDLFPNTDTEGKIRALGIEKSVQRSSGSVITYEVQDLHCF